MYEELKGKEVGVEREGMVMKYLEGIQCLENNDNRLWKSNNNCCEIQRWHIAHIISHRSMKFETGSQATSMTQFPVLITRIIIC